MKHLIAAICFTLAATPFAFAQDKAKDMDKKASAAMEKSAEKASMERPKGKSEGSQPAKEPSDKQKAQQARMKDCAGKAGDRKGDDRNKFMSSCLKGQSAEKKPDATTKTAQQTKMGDCNKEAKEKTLKGDDRKKFMKECLSK